MPDEDTWEPAENLVNAPEAVAKFHSEHTEAVNTFDQDLFTLQGRSIIPASIVHQRSSNVERG